MNWLYLLYLPILYLRYSPTLHVGNAIVVRDDLLDDLLHDLGFRLALLLVEILLVLRRLGVVRTQGRGEDAIPEAKLSWVVGWWAQRTR